MLVDRIEKSLKEMNFEKGIIEGANLDIRTFMKKENETEFKVVFVFNNDNGHRSSGEILENVNRRISQILYMNKATDVESICLVLTSNPEIELSFGKGDNKEKAFADTDVKYWIIDSNQKRIMIFDDQPQDFCEIYKPVEEALFTVDENEEAEKRRNITLEAFPVITAILIIANILYFIFLEAYGSTQDGNFMLKMGATNPSKVLNDKEYYRLFVAMFMHFGVEHIFGNMFMLFAIGSQLEKRMGSIAFAFMYISTGLIANILSCAKSIGEGADVVGAGASGAIYGILGAYIIFMMVEILQMPPQYRMQRFTNAVTRVIIVVILTMSEAFMDGSVDVTAHIVGLISGMILTRLWFLIGPGRRFITGNE